MVLIIIFWSGGFVNFRIHSYFYAKALLGPAIIASLFVRVLVKIFVTPKGWLLLSFFGEWDK